MDGRRSRRGRVALIVGVSVGCIAAVAAVSGPRPARANGAPPLHAGFDSGSRHGFESGPGWAATIVGDGHRGRNALRLTKVGAAPGIAPTTTAATPAAWVTTAPIAGPAFLTGWVKGSPGRSLTAAIGGTTSAPITIDGTWQAFGATNRRRGAGALTVELRPEGRWEIGDSIVLDTVDVRPATPTPVRVVPGTRILEVDGEPFTVQGTNYNTSQIGAMPYVDSWAVDPALCQNDATLMRGAGVNTIRIWGNHPADAPIENRIACLDAFAANGIGVLWLVRGPGFQHDPTRVDPDVFREAFWTQLQAYLADYAWHPATLFWSINNEVEVNSTPEGHGIWFGSQGGDRGMLDVLAERVLEVDPVHLVGTAMSDRCWEGYGSMLRANVPHLQYWGVNLYPNPPENLATKTCDGVQFFDKLNEDPRPKFIHEFGLDRYHCLRGAIVRNPNNPGGPAHVISCRPGSGERQEPAADWLGRIWDTITPQLASPDNPSGALSGGLEFKWGDDWWGVLAGLNPAQTNHTHDVAGVINAGQMGRIDGVANGEWIGITHAPDPNVATPRVTTLLLDELAIRWRGPGPILGDVELEPLPGCGARVTWTTPEPATSELNTGVREVVTNPANGDVVSDSTRFRRTAYRATPATTHQLEVTGLVPGVEHHLVARSFAADGRSATIAPLSMRCPAA